MALELPRIHLAGSPTAMGTAYGERLREPIRAFVAQRQRAAVAYLRERGIRDPGRLVGLARACLALLRTWHPEGWQEHVATAAAAGIEADVLYAAANYTDLRDLIAYGTPDAPIGVGAGTRADQEGCTALLLPPSATVGHEVIAAQTWDLNPEDLEFVVAVERRPSQGLATWSVTCAGCPSLIGMNGAGVAVGTTNIKTRGGRIGIPYLSLLHRALGSTSAAAAAETIATAPRAAAHTFWCADATEAVELECSPTRVVRRQADVALARTNHCLDPAHQAIEGEPPSTSSRARLARAEAAAAAGQLDVERLQALFADRSDGVDSINRRPEDGQGTATNACIIARPAQRSLDVCRGPADRGAWVHLTVPAAT